MSSVLSTPNSTSPSGLPAASTALLTTSPASPPVTIFSVRPVAFSKSATSASDSANESWVTRTTESGAAPSVDPQAARATESSQPEPGGEEPAAGAAVMSPAVMRQVVKRQWAHGEPSLRWHYPVQVEGSVAAATLSARRIPRAPLVVELLPRP